MMKKVLLMMVGMASIFLVSVVATAKTATYTGKGEVTAVDSPYGRITIKHGAIKGYSGDGETEFPVTDAGILKGIERRDLIDFELMDTNGDVRVPKITKTGVAPEEEKVGLGRVVQDVLVGTGEVAKTVTKPITPAHDIVSGAVDATTGATDNVLRNADTQSKQNF